MKTYNQELYERSHLYDVHNTLAIKNYNEEDRQSIPS
jgi:hypothetical protein